MMLAAPGHVAAGSAEASAAKAVNEASVTGTAEAVPFPKGSSMGQAETQAGTPVPHDSRGPQTQLQIQPVRDFEMESRHATSIPFRDMPTVDVAPPHPHVEHEPLKRPIPANMRTSAATTAGPDRVAQIQHRILGAMPTLGLNFLGEGNSLGGLGGDPSDSEGNIGATQYVEFINTAFAIFDKKTGVLLAGPTAGSTLFTNLGGDCAATDDGDPIVQYDKAANRWILSQFSVAHAFKSSTGSDPASECIAVSQTSDATGVYNLYQFTYTDFNDYPKMGVWTDKWLVNYNMFQLPTTPISSNPNVTPGSYVGDEMCALDRTNMLADNPAKQACAPPNINEFTLLPSDLDGSTAPPASDQGFFMDLGNTTFLDMYGVNSVDFVGGTLTLNTPVAISIPSFTFPCGFINNGNTVCVPQNDGGKQQLDTIGDRLMYRLAYRNMGGTETVLASHTVDLPTAGNQTGIRWYEIRNLSGTPTVFQSGTYAPDSNYRWVPSIAMDQTGNIAVGYSVGSAGLNASIDVSTRSASDPAGTLGNETLIQTGNGAQTGGSRWGDYTAMTVDPVDDCTMWYINQYMGTSGTFNWDTKIANFQMAGCVRVTQLAITTAPASAQAGVPFSVTVKAEGGSGQTIAGYRGTVHFTSSDGLANLPADYTFTAADGGAHTFTISLVSLGSQTVTVADANNNSISSGQATIVVGPGPTTQLGLSATSPETAGTAFTLTVTAKDQFGNTATGYTGTVHFTSSDPSAVLPVNSTLTNGTKAFNVMLKTAGNQTMTATDTVNNSIAGTKSITVNAAAASQFLFVVPATAKSGTAFSFRLTAEDQFGNVATGYRGTATFTSTDGGATLPAAYTFVAGDNGIHVFSATLGTNGSQTITATDATDSISKISGTITVGAGDPALHAVARQIRIFRATPSVIAGSFTDDDTAETGSNLSASINWGDGTTTPGNVVHVGGLPNLFNVLGSHTYKTKSRFTVTVTVTDSAGGGVTVNSTAQFGPRTFAF